MSITVLQSRRDNISERQLATLESQPLAEGEVRIKVDQFALTANNITYGVAGDVIGYWQFFPAEDPWGCIPVWGFGDVIESQCSEVSVGERLYGYFPMATEVTLQPIKVNHHGLTDGAAHRAALPMVYNQYTKVAADPAYQKDLESEQMLYRPLFTTSFFLDDFLFDNDFFAATNVVLVSASSKTAIGLAQLLAARKKDSADASFNGQLIGLTSATNTAFVEGLGCYDQVIAYDQINSLPAQSTVVVDMAGNGKVRRVIHETLADHLKYDCGVGATHWDEAMLGGNGNADPMPGPAPQMFFAPSQIEKRIKEWGREGFEQKMSQAWGDFLQASKGWIEINNHNGAEQLCSVYDQFIDGSADPARGYIMSVHSAG